MIVFCHVNRIQFSYWKKEFMSFIWCKWKWEDSLYNICYSLIINFLRRKDQKRRKRNFRGWLRCWNTISSAARLPVFFDSHISLNFLFVELNLCQNIVYVYSYITRIFTSLLMDFLEIGNRKVLRKSQTFRL